MGIVSSIGTGSGIDIGGLVKQLVELEGKTSLTSIARRESNAKIQLSAQGSLKSALSNFSKAAETMSKEDTFKQYQTQSSNTAILSINTTAGASTGTYAIKVQQLAESHKLLSSGYTNADSVVGSGTLTLTVGSDSFSIELNATNNKLSSIRDEINSAADNTGVNASIIYVDDGIGGTVAKLSLAAKNTGTINSLVITAVEDVDAPGLSNLIYDPDNLITNLSEQNAAQDAKINVDGQTATRSSNTIYDVIDGLSLDLIAADIGTTVDVSVSLNTDNVVDNVKNFVSAYNSLMSTIGDLGAYNADTKKSGAMSGDSFLNSIQRQARLSVSEKIDGASTNYDSLAMLGVSIDSKGVMTLDDSKLSGLLKTNLPAVIEVFSSTAGVGNRIDTNFASYLKFGGVFDSRSNSLDAQLRAVADDRDDVKRRLSDYESRITKEFIAMDRAMGQFQSTGAYLAQQLSALSNNRSNRK